MLRMGTIWDRTVEVINGRNAILASIAMLLLFVPSILQTIIRLAVYGVQSRPLALTLGVIGIVVAVLALWGMLALTAVASDPAVNRRDALAIGRERLPVGIGVVLLMSVAVALISLPPMWMLYLLGVDFIRAQQGLPQAMTPGNAGLALLVVLVLMAIFAWITARLLPLFAIVVNERRGWRAFARSLELTRGSTLRLIGVLILYLIVVLVVGTAATWVFGIGARLAFGADGVRATAFVVALVSAFITAGFSVLQIAFAARFYVAARELRDGA